MRKINLLLILLVFLSPLSLFAKEAKKKEETRHYYKKESLNHTEWVDKLKNHLNPLQTFPLFNKDDLEFQLGPAQFQMTIPFR